MIPEESDDVFANRGEPVPLLTVTNSDDGSSTSEVEVGGKRTRLKKTFSASKLKEKMQDVGQAHQEKIQAKSPSLQDRLFSK